MPVSKLVYSLHAPTAQALLIHGSDAPDSSWNVRVAASIFHGGAHIHGVVRDLLANPHIRAIVFEGNIPERGIWETFWRDTTVPDWGIDREHIMLVRQFVDLFDDDFFMRGKTQPFWPTRIKYLDKQED